jgi:DnaJ-class molecular chaperone
VKWQNINQDLNAVLEEYRNLTPYEILRVNSSASENEIRNAYREMLKTYHPDVTDSFIRSVNLEVTKLINAAYEVIIKERHGAR